MSRTHHWAQNIYRWAQEEQRYFPKHQSPWIAGKDRGHESFDACVMLEVFPDRLYSLTAGVHIMREQSSGFGSVSGIVIQLRWFDLVLGFLCPSHVKLTSLRESTSATSSSGKNIRLWWFSNYKWRNIAWFQWIMGLRLISIHTEHTGTATSDEFSWKEQMERSLLYWREETIHLHQDKTETPYSKSRCASKGFLTHWWASIMELRSWIHHISRLRWMQQGFADFLFIC